VSLLVYVADVRFNLERLNRNPYTHSINSCKNSCSKVNNLHSNLFYRCEQVTEFTLLLTNFLYSLLYRTASKYCILTLLALNRTCITSFVTDV
jgi:hypothetical protein